MSAEARLLVAHLRKATIGQHFTYAELSEIVSHPVAAGGPLATALNRLLKDHDMVFGTVRGKGITRLADREIVDEGVATVNAIRRKARRSVERMSKADFSALPREYQARFSAHTAVMATVSHMTGATQMARIEQKVPLAKQALPVKDTLRMFQK